MSRAINIFLLIAIVSANPANAALFKLSIIHYNDFHSRFEETNGRFPRMYTEIQRLLKVKPNVILIDTGDDFFGTHLFSLFRWKIIVEFLNMLPLDALVLGSHELNDEVNGLLPYFKKLKVPVVGAKIDASGEPAFQGKVKDWVVVQRDNRDIAIIGYMHSHIDEIAKTGNLKFTDEVEAVNRESARLNKSGVGIIVAVSHAGIDVDERVAKNCLDVDVVVGGHTHTLYTGTPASDGKVYGEYPLVVAQASGRKVLIIEAESYSKYLGNIIVKFDEAGEVVKWEGNAIYLDSSIKEDPKILSALEPWKKEADEKTKEVVGSTKVNLDLMVGFLGESSMCNMITDAMVYEQYKNALTYK